MIESRRRGRGRRLPWLFFYIFCGIVSHLAFGFFYPSHRGCVTPSGEGAVPAVNSLAVLELTASKDVTQLRADDAPPDRPPTSPVRKEKDVSATNGKVEGKPLVIKTANASSQEEEEDYRITQLSFRSKDKSSRISKAGRHKSSAGGAAHSVPRKPQGVSKPLALAIVFPQFHPIPENDRFWGANFTEWTLLRPTPRYVVGDEVVIYKPHPDLGYYNLLDVEHRRFMRVLADRFGLHGFIYYHFWFKDHPVMHRPLEHMLADGEPRKPFALCWSNEAWTRRWDGSWNDILLPQDYTDAEGNEKHFYHLLPLFKHELYIKVNGKPIFFFYRIEKRDVKDIIRIMRLWQKLAVKEGLGGVLFAKFNGPFENAIVPEGIEAYIQFEPGFSSPSSIRTYPKEGPYKGFTLVDSSKAWSFMENRLDHEAWKPFYRGSCMRWNNAPRRNFTNGNYDNYPMVYVNYTMEAYEAHLRRLFDKARSDALPWNETNSYVMLTAWNEWNEQSMIEPNDVDGYDVLMAIKRTFMPPTSKAIVHVSHRGGGTELYIRHLMYLFPEYGHLYIDDAKLPHPQEQETILLHIHSAHVLNGPKWRVIDTAKAYRESDVAIYITVHDYQWLFPATPNPSLEQLSSSLTPAKEDVAKAAELFSLATKVIFPERFLQAYFRKHLEQVWSEERMELVTHNDLLTHDDLLSVPSIDKKSKKKKSLNVAFVGELVEYKGAHLFLSLALNNRDLRFEGHQVEFHHFGRVPDESALTEADKEAITFHGPYQDELLEETLHKANIHAVAFVSIFPETHAYALTRLLRAGVPLVYLDRGACSSRLAGMKHAFAVEQATEEGLKEGLTRALQFVMAHEGERHVIKELSTHVQPTKWYLSNYPQQYCFS